MFYHMYNYHIDLHVPSVKCFKYDLPPPLSDAAGHTAPPTSDAPVAAEVEDAELDDTMFVDPTDAKDAAETAEETRQLYEHATRMSTLEKTTYAFNIVLVAALFALSRSQ